MLPSGSAEIRPDWAVLASHIDKNVVVQPRPYRSVDTERMRMIPDR
jgi:hypothetical protein